MLLNDLVQPLRTSYDRLSKLKELVETTLDLKQAEMGEYIVRADFDDKLGGEYAECRSSWLSLDCVLNLQN